MITMQFDRDGPSTSAPPATSLRCSPSGSHGWRIGSPSIRRYEALAGVAGARDSLFRNLGPWGRPPAGLDVGGWPQECGWPLRRSRRGRGCRRRSGAAHAAAPWRSPARRAVRAVGPRGHV